MNYHETKNLLSRKILMTLSTCIRNNLFKVTKKDRKATPKMMLFVKIVHDI